MSNKTQLTTDQAIAMLLGKTDDASERMFGKNDEGGAFDGLAANQAAIAETVDSILSGVVRLGKDGESLAAAVRTVSQNQSAIAEQLNEVRRDIANATDPSLQAEALGYLDADVIVGAVRKAGGRKAVQKLSKRAEKKGRKKGKKAKAMRTIKYVAYVGGIAAAGAGVYHLATNAWAGAEAGVDAAASVETGDSAGGWKPHAGIA